MKRKVKCGACEREDVEDLPVLACLFRSFFSGKVDFVICDKCFCAQKELMKQKKRKEPIVLARFMHDQYEEIAEEVGWDTQETCKHKAFHELPVKNQQVMIKLAEKIQEALL